MHRFALFLVGVLVATTVAGQDYNVPFRRHTVAVSTDAEIEEFFATDPFTSRWTKQPSTANFSWTSADLDWVLTADDLYIYAQSTTALTDAVEQWVCAEITMATPGTVDMRGVTFRGDDGTGTDVRYAFAIRDSDDRVYWAKETGINTHAPIFTGNTCGTLTTDGTADLLCVRVEATGASTKVSAWMNPTIDATPDPADWGAATCTICASGCDRVGDCSTGSLCIDSGAYVGVHVDRDSGTVSTSFDNFYASPKD